MGIKINQRLMRGGHELIGFDPKPEARKDLEDKGAESSDSLLTLVAKLPTPRQRIGLLPGFAEGTAGSLRHSAESSSSSYGPTVRLRVLSTAPRSDAVTLGYGAVAHSDTDFHRVGLAPSRAHSPPTKTGAYLTELEQSFFGE